jgi:hypothetical protein
MRAEKKAWLNMQYRCHNPNNAGYRHYGGRGITVCDRWRQSFDAFFADVGPRPTPNHSIDRIDNNGNYEPGNVRWATKRVQVANRRTGLAAERNRIGLERVWREYLRKESVT